MSSPRMCVETTINLVLSFCFILLVVLIIFSYTQFAMNDLFSNPLAFIFYSLSLVIAITIHEFAHAYTADRLGDPTPKLQGRLTLNPLAHLDPLGTIMLFLVHFGWGKPVQFDPFNLRNPRRDAAIISLAGPVSNVTLAVLCSLSLRLFPLISPMFSVLIGFLQTLIVINVILAVFNLVPIHPLDGFKIVGGFLSPQQAKEWYSLERYGMIFLLFLLFPLFTSTAPISLIISPVINFLLNFLLPNTPLI